MQLKKKNEILFRVYTMMDYFFIYHKHRFSFCEENKCTKWYKYL